jgi:hypothetical protein
MIRGLSSRRHLVVYGGGPGYVGQLGNWGRVGLAWYLTDQLDHTTEDELKLTEQGSVLHPLPNVDLSFHWTPSLPYRFPPDQLIPFTRPRDRRWVCDPQNQVQALHRICIPH